MLSESECFPNGKNAKQRKKPRLRHVIDRAQNSYGAAWAAACKRIAVQATKDNTECISSMGLSKDVCDQTYPNRNASSTCTLPQATKAELAANLERALDGCVQEK